MTAILKTMSEKKEVKKAPQLSLEEYNKVKEKRAKSKLQLHLPLGVKIFLGLPIAYFVFLIAYYLLYIRFASEH